MRLADGFAYVGASHSLGIIGGKNSHAMAEIGVKFVQRRRGLVQPKFGSWADFFLTQRRSGAEKYSVLHGFCRREEEWNEGEGNFLFAFNSCLDYNFHSFKTSLSYKRRRNEKKITGIAWNLRVDWRFF